MAAVYSIHIPQSLALLVIIIASYFWFAFWVCLLIFLSLDPLVFLAAFMGFLL
jgi:hypothetical protein